ncbi:hypothetical protein EV401DRAFT_99432 [Pisolithus croceorrhizus]|nr:hypothetical protein EV401DRAFT_99432 [Pisolithus croceorrhizus]
MATKAYHDQQWMTPCAPVYPTRHQLSNVQQATGSDDDERLSALLEEFLELREQYTAHEAEMVELRNEVETVVDKLYEIAALIMPMELQVLLNLALWKAIDLLKMESWNDLLRYHSSSSFQSKMPLPDFIYGMFVRRKIPSPSLKALLMLCDYGDVHLHTQANKGTYSMSRDQVRYAVTCLFEYPYQAVLEELYAFTFGTNVYDDRIDDVLTTTMVR